MPKGYIKYMKKQDSDLKKRLLNAVLKIENLDLEDLDCKKMKGGNSNQDLFRVRVGKFRIVFIKKDHYGEIQDIDTRGDIYK